MNQLVQTIEHERISKLNRDVQNLHVKLWSTGHFYIKRLYLPIITSICSSIEVREKKSKDICS